MLLAVVGLPGEGVEIRDGAVYLNGERMTPPPEFAWLQYESEFEPAATPHFIPPNCRSNCRMTNTASWATIQHSLTTLPLLRASSAAQPPWSRHRPIPVPASLDDLALIATSPSQAFPINSDHHPTETPC